jgi:tRNA-dihydrouridine synthase B
MYIVGMKPPNFKDSMAVIYAPIAGVSDSPSRKIARMMGADMTVSELISAEGVLRGNRKTMELAEFDDSERPFGIQLFGANPDSMADAARIMEELNPDFLDINFGCPARKIVCKNGGSSILRDLDLMRKIVAKVVAAVEIPVTVKMRSGWDDRSLVYLEAGRIIEDCGAVAVTLHPRTKIQGFSGTADWSHIRELKNNVGIAVIGNGDIFTPSDAFSMFDQTGCDAVMIGRASFGNPWIFQQIKEFKINGKLPAGPSPRHRIEMALKHLDMALERYGLPRGVYLMRSRLGWYIKGLPEASAVRERLNRLVSPTRIKNLLTGYMDEGIRGWDDDGLVSTVNSSQEQMIDEIEQN